MQSRTISSTLMKNLRFNLSLESFLMRTTLMTLLLRLETISIDTTLKPGTCKSTRELFRLSMRCKSKRTPRKLKLELRKKLSEKPLSRSKNWKLRKRRRRNSPSGKKSTKTPENLLSRTHTKPSILVSSIKTSLPFKLETISSHTSIIPLSGSPVLMRLLEISKRLCKRRMLRSKRPMQEIP